MKPITAAACLFVLIAASALPVSAQTCNRPDKPASVAEMPKIDFPSIKHSPAHGTVVLRVDISAQGELTGHEFLQRTGNTNLDMAALRAVHQVKYTPEILNCKPAAGSYMFIVTFPE